MATQPGNGGGFSHRTIERNVTLLGILSLVAVAIGGIVEIAPLFWVDSTVEKVEGVRPYTPLELAGRNIYIREGCYLCHSQMVPLSSITIIASGTVANMVRCKASLL